MSKLGFHTMHFQLLAGGNDYPNGLMPKGLMDDPNMNPSLNPPPSLPSVNFDAGGVGNWIGEKAQEGANALLDPIGRAIGDAFTNLFTGIMHALPMMFVAGGLVCFLITIALGRHKPYLWGLGMWGLSAIIRGINIEMGIS